MSIRPEIPHLGGPAQRLSSALADANRKIAKLEANNKGRDLKGFQDVTFTASAQATWASPGINSPTGHVAGVASSGVVGGKATFCTVTDSGSGSVAIVCQTYDNVAVTGTTRIYYHIWPY